MIKILLDIVGIEETVKKSADQVVAAKRASDLWLSETVQKEAEALRAQFPKQTGESMQSIMTRKLGQSKYEIYSDNPIVSYLEDGTGIYGKQNTPIVPVSAKALRFKINGKIVFAKSVRGIKPMHLFANKRQDLKNRTSALAASLKAAVMRAMGI